MGIAMLHPSYALPSLFLGYHSADCLNIHVKPPYG